MNLLQLRCFVVLAETLHFGRAAQSLGMLPASLGRHIRLLEENLGATLVARTTRNVALTEAGSQFLPGAQDLILRADALERAFREQPRSTTRVLRVGAMDSVAAGLLPQILPHFREQHPDVSIELLEQKTIRLLPKLLSGRLDIAFIRPPDVRDPRIHFRALISETAVVALPAAHPMADRQCVEIMELADEPLIVPDRRSRPHSHDLTMKLFLQSGLTARVTQIADEKQTIVNLVASGIGIAIVPRWTSRLAVAGVRFIPIDTRGDSPGYRLDLSAAWLKGVRDEARDALMLTLDERIEALAASA